MIPLPNGLTAGISNIRARYHALRLNRRITHKTPHRELYGLVDIVIDPNPDQQLPYHYTPRYRFTGHTLADLTTVKNWTPDDHHAFWTWLRQDDQIRTIEQARNRIISDDFPSLEQSFSYPQRLYSRLIRLIETMALQRASAKQWRNTLLNLNQHGVREEEISWSGILPFLTECLKQEPCVITKEALLAHIDFSAIRLLLTNELVSEKSCDLDFLEIPQFNFQKPLQPEKKIAEANEICIVRYVDTVHYYKVGFIKPLIAQSLRSRHKWFVLDTVGNPIINPASQGYHFLTKETAFKTASQHALQHVGIPVEYTPCRRYEHKTLCGGDDYREWLLTLPDYPISHFTGHYHARNLLLHFRTKHRIDTQGRDLLFIEEIQSDWHQSGAMYGYLDRWPGQIPPAPFRKEWLALALKLLLLHAAEKDVDAIAWTQGNIQESHYAKRMSTVRRLYDTEIPRCLLRLCKPWHPHFAQSRILTREPRLHISRQTDRWYITDVKGSGFSTRPRYSQQEAIKVMARHCKQIELEVPSLFLSRALKTQIQKAGFPLFGL
jgi:hypothetical protein